MLVINLLIPMIMIGFGIRFMNKPPKKINKLFGFRTTLSMKNMDTWIFAHKHCGKLWRNIGLSIIIPSMIATFIALGREETNADVFTAIHIGIQIIIMLISSFFTEKALHENFDIQGNPL